MIKAWFFDVDNTLYDYDTAHAAALQALTGQLGPDLGLSPEAFAALHQEAYRIQQDRVGAQTAAIHSRLLRYQIMLERLGKPLSLAPRMTGLYWTAFLAHMRMTPGADTCMAFLRERGCAVGIGTNMTADYQYAKLERLGLLRYVDLMVTSEEAGAEKPDPRFFRLCVQKAGCAAGECVFLGDNPVHDVQGAEQAGLRPVWLRPAAGQGEVPAHVPQLRTLEEVPELFRSQSLRETARP